MTSRFTQKAQNTLNNSLRYAREMGHTYVGSEHLLLALSAEEDSMSRKILEKYGAAPEQIREKIVEMVGEGDESDVTAGDLTPRTKRIIQNSAVESQRAGQNYIGTEHLLLALLAESDCVGVKILEDLKVQLGALRQELISVLGMSAAGEQPAREGSRQSDRPEQKTLADTPTLAQYGRDLTAMARAGKIDPVIGREKETERVIQILSRRGKNNPCLIGEPGVGKTAVVEGLAQKIADGTVPDTLRDKQIVTLDIAAMVAGAKYRGEFEERLKSVMEEVAKKPNIYYWKN